MTAEPIELRAASRAAMPDLSGASPELLRDCVATWRARMINEYSSAVVFEALAAQLEPTFGADLAHACREFATEERHHGVLCGAVVEAAGGEARAHTLDHAPFPLHTDAPPRAAALRNVIHVCCMSETVAVALIGAERLEMPEGSLRTLLTRIWADEVGHARFGWRLLESIGATLTAPERAAVERYLPTAFAHLETHELAHLPERAAPQGGAAYGLCSGADGRVLFYDTLERIIRPGLRRWFDC
ncbi:MAG TPA: ferritin-like domain-containing protein [Polyangiaceae bacterium]|nr:ferritin-like domain-containing protein [Polyangiaceae bacterium]